MEICVVVGYVTQGYFSCKLSHNSVPRQVAQNVAWCNNLFKISCLNIKVIETYWPVQRPFS